MRLDSVDISILTELQDHGRLTNAELAERVGLSASACHRRVKALEQAGVIDRYVAILSEKALGRGITVYVQVTLDNQKRETLVAFEEAVETVPEVMECYLMSGDADYLVRVLVRDANDYERVHREVLSGLPGVARLVSSFTIRRVFSRTTMPVPDEVVVKGD
ncbi:MAG: AsnC family transcriptional regulator [Oceanicaulis sp.]|uniref:AsnC family transcriptional regulator n=1 Tax=Maricaulis virginensis TaxID=144022 RepID=A0A9W6IME6_9PROT|nr:MULTISPECIES: Lrp/AsnC family transcriptional regulator [Maricaulis]MAZ91237.1 AsnC family transcriptional regulator [Maricaulis sp.]MBI76059.1 AsnC family transcriptional regulator [Oceanicaulis sp.]MBO6765402.1 Lrp/AsnC family transcriptional regulator [Maricaulis sp.]GLK51606.1 AsnC family transcriptional regulator [Maricaulis virginensis]